MNLVKIGVSTLALAVSFQFSTVSANSCSIVPNGLVACYPFDGDAKDYSGNSLHGTTNGGVTLTSDRFGTPNKAYYFDGKSYVDVGSSTLLNVNQHTIAGWIKPEPKIPTTGNNSNRAILGKVKPFVYETLSFEFTPENRFRTAFATDGQKNYHLSSNSVLQNEKWHFVAMTYDGQQVILYKDGVLDSKYPRTGTLRINTNSLAIGRHGGDANQLGDDNFFKGAIDDLLIYNRALSEEEISNFIMHQKENAQIQRLMMQKLV